MAKERDRKLEKARVRVSTMLTLAAEQAFHNSRAG